MPLIRGYKKRRIIGEGGREERGRRGLGYTEPSAYEN